MKQNCPIAGRCGGCPWADVPYETQLARKSAYIRELLAPFGVESGDCVPGPEEGCRNKVHLVFGREGGRTRVGFFSGGSARFVPAGGCPMHGEWFPALARALEAWANAQHLPPYDPRSGKGTLRFAAGRYLEGKLLLTVVSQRERVPGLPALHGALEETVGETSLWLNVNDRRDSAVFSRNFRHIAGPRGLEGEMLGVRFRLSPESFFQVNESMAARLYTRIVDLARESGAQQVLDAYSGIGITSLLFARGGMSVVSVEQVPAAVAEARRLAEENGLSDSIRALCGDCARVLPGLRLAGETLFFVDPPRRGLGESVCRTILRFGPKHMIYLSCGPEALARDLRTLTRGGYRVVSAQPWDLFPNTPHVETVVLLSRETNPLTVEVRMEVETGEVKEHPTYKRIQEYVQEKYGFKVHTAYIAEVKRMVGLDMHKAPNAVEQRKHEYHPCPPEKVEAIKDALRHFGLIAE